MDKLLLLLTNIIYGGSLITSPWWLTGVLMATSMANGSGRSRGRLQIGGQVSLVLLPISLIYTLIYQNIIGHFIPQISLLPLIPVTCYIACMYYLPKDKK